MKVDDDGIGALAQPASLKFAFNCAERAIEIGHENAPHGINDQNVRAIGRLENPRAAPRRAFRIIQWAQHALLAFDEYKCLALVPDVVPGGNNVRARIEE